MLASTGSSNKHLRETNRQQFAAACNALQCVPSYASSAPMYEYFCLVRGAGGGTKRDCEVASVDVRYSTKLFTLANQL